MRTHLSASFAWSLCLTLLVALAAPLSLLGGVTVVENQGDGTDWPDSDAAIDVAAGHDPAYFTTGVSVPAGGSVSQTFTPIETFMLDKIDVAYTSSGIGVVGVRLQEANAVLNAGGTAYEYTAGANLFPTSNLSFAPSVATPGVRVLTLDFTGNDEITLEAGKTYAIEFYDTGASTPSFALRRRGSSTYGGGALFANRSSVNGTNTRDAGMRVFASDSPLSGYQVTFFDDFDSLSVSPHGSMNGARWNARTPWNGDFGGAAFRDPSPGFPFTVNNGVLRIELRKNASTGKWESGLLSSIGTDGEGFAQQFGYFEMRAKLPAGDGIWPAFWLFTKTRVTDPSDLSIVNVEIDAVEYYGQRPDRYSTNIHRWDRDWSDGNQSIHDPQHILAEGMTDDFHTYGLQVEDDCIRFYYDGVVVREEPTPPEAKAPLFVLLNLALDTSEAPFDDALNPSYMYVDYVKVMARENPDIVVDNANLTGVTITGTWTGSTSVSGFYGINYAHDGNAAKGSRSVRFTPDVPTAGDYEVFARWTADPNRASNVPITITSASGVQVVTVNQQANGGEWVSLGTYAFDAGTAGNVLISNAGTNGYVIADAIKLVKVSP